MLLRTRIVLIFAIASVLLIMVATAPFWVMEQLTNGALSEAKQEAQQITWNGAVADALTPYEIVISRLADDAADFDASHSPDNAVAIRLLEQRRKEAGLTRLDLIGDDGRLLASSAGLAADAPLLDTANLRNRLQTLSWLRGLAVGPDGSFQLVMTSAFPGGRFVSAAVSAAPVMRAMARGGTRSLFIMDRRGTLRLSTNPADWPEIARALGQRGNRSALITRGTSTFAAVSTPLIDLAGSYIGTLIAVDDVTEATQRQELVGLLMGSVTVMVFALLLFALYGFAKDALDPLGEITLVIRAMAAGDANVSIDGAERKDEIGAIAAALEVFRRDIVTLARNKTRETLRQAQQQALIRREMTILASMLEADEREALLGDLRGTLASAEEGVALAEAFKRMAARVVAQHARLGALLAERSRDLEVVREALSERAHLTRLRQELEVARHLQLSSLPRIFPPFPDRTEFELFAAMEPAKEVGGDFYDFALVGGDRLALMIGDASGKGVSAAMFMAMGRSILRSAIVRGASPGQALALANSTLAVENHTMMFATAFIGILDLRTGWLTYASAGHNPPYVVIAGQPPLAINGSPGIALGILEDAEYDDSDVQLPQGASVVLFTDGVTEANDPEGGMFGEESLEAELAKLRLEGPEQGVARIQQALRIFARGAEQADDITVLAARWLGAAPVKADVLAKRLPVQPEI